MQLWVKRETLSVRKVEMSQHSMPGIHVFEGTADTMDDGDNVCTID